MSVLFPQVIRVSLLALGAFSWNAWAEPVAGEPKRAFVAASGGGRTLHLLQTSSSAGAGANFSTWSLVNMNFSVEVLPKEGNFILQLTESLFLGRAGAGGSHILLNELEAEGKFPLYRISANLLWLGTAGVRWMLAPLFTANASGQAEATSHGFWFGQVGSGLFYRMNNHAFSFYAKFGQPLTFFGAAEGGRNFAWDLNAAWTTPLRENLSLQISPGVSFQRLEFKTADGAGLERRGTWRMRQVWLYGGVSTFW